MKGLVFLCALGVALTLAAAYPQNRYRVYKNSRSKSRPVAKSGKKLRLFFNVRQFLVNWQIMVNQNLQATTRQPFCNQHT